MTAALRTRVTRTAWCVVGVVGVLTVASGTAHALKPGTHADIAKASCKAAGLSSDFCTRIATEDYDTDEREWDDLRAHAQIDDGETACVAADRTAERLRGLGYDLPAALAKARASGSLEDVGAVSELVGRALHTIQDNCAHHGMPNPQHAWFSLGDFCEGTSTSPDVQDDAAACARTESDAVMRDVARAVAQANAASILSAKSCPPAPNNGPHNNSGPPAVCQGRYLPGPIDACSFLGRAKDWDGTDRRWNNTVAVPALRTAFEAGLGGATTADSVCGGDESRLSPSVSEPIVDVSTGAPSCAKASLFCLGKADDSENPFADDATTADTGCSTTGARSGLWMIGLALLLLFARRSSARRVKRRG